MLTKPQSASYARKRHYALQTNLIRFVDQYRCYGVIDMTFPDPLTVRQANRRFHSFWTNVLSDYFDCYSRVLEAHKDGRPHFHLLVRTRNNLDLYNHTNKRAIRKHVQLTAARYGVGRTQIEGLIYDAHYRVDYMLKGLDRTANIFPGARLVTFSRNFPKSVGPVSTFSANDSGARFWRQQVSHWADSRGLDYERVRTLHGPRWFYSKRQDIAIHTEAMRLKANLPRPRVSRSICRKGDRGGVVLPASTSIS
jgi:hypothetical protein